MTQTPVQPDDATPPPPVAPYSVLIRKATGICLILGGLTNGLSQYVNFLIVGGRLEWLDQVRWGADNPVFQRVDASILVISALFMPLGLLGIAQVTRWSARRLTLIGTPLMLWGMWGFHNILAGGMIAGPVATRALGEEGAVALNEGMMTDAVGFFLAPLPHLLGTLPGIILLTIAAWRSGAFPKVACAIVLAFLAWDYFLPPVGLLLEPHLLLFVGWTWLGISLIRMPHAVWSGATSQRTGVDGSPPARASTAAY